MSVKDFLGRESIGRYIAIPIVTALKIEGNKLEGPSSFDGILTMKLDRQVVFQGRQEERAELSLKWCDLIQILAIEKRKEEALGQILGVFGAVSPPSNKRIQGVPIQSAQLLSGNIRTRGLTLRRKQNRTPAGGP